MREPKTGPWRPHAVPAGGSSWHPLSTWRRGHLPAHMPAQRQVRFLLLTLTMPGLPSTPDASCHGLRSRRQRGCRCSLSSAPASCQVPRGCSGGLLPTIGISLLKSATYKTLDGTPFPPEALSTWRRGPSHGAVGSQGQDTVMGAVRAKWEWGTHNSPSCHNQHWHGPLPNTLPLSHCFLICKMGIVTHTCQPL